MILYLFLFIGSMLAVCFVTPSFGFVFVAIFAVYLSVTNYYRVVARELKRCLLELYAVLLHTVVVEMFVGCCCYYYGRLDSLSRSPIFSHFSETLGGLPIIRAFRRQKMFQRGDLRIYSNVLLH